MNDTAATVTSIAGGRDKPSWAPSWAPSSSTLSYLQKLFAVALFALGALYFLGFRSLKPFAARHVAAV